MDAPLTHQSFKHLEQRRANASAGKFRGRIQPLQMTTANGTPSGHHAIKLGNPNLQLAKLLLHAGERKLGRPDSGFFKRHSRRRQSKDRLSPDFEETARVIARGQTMNSAHVDL